MYNGSEVTCYDELRLTKMNFHDLCTMLRMKCGLKDSVYVTDRRKVAMFLLVVGHGIKMRVLCGTYKRSLETISRHFSNVFLCSSMAEGTGTGKRNYVTWDDEMDTAMLEVLVHHHNMGDHSQNGWKAHVYSAAIKNVKEKCNKDITKNNILGRFRTFDNQFEIINKVLSQSGFGWDWVNHKLSIDSNHVWTKYLEVTSIHFHCFNYFFVCNKTGQQHLYFARLHMDPPSNDHLISPSTLSLRR
ncbi:hypothetical protein VPH35_101159 [Triticum aestivum]|uniref:Uncharacterized protein n=1 Tax=Aegilops tauschii subsp. strangulata TaxID=200361 RepID=A0A453MB21_AEGTS